MKKYKNLAKRSLAILLALVMCMGLLGTTALADTTGEEICGFDEHTHSVENDCYAMGVTVDHEETPNIYNPDTDETIVGHKHTPDCYKETVTDKLKCDIVEHTHTEACYSTIGNDPSSPSTEGCQCGKCETDCTCTCPDGECDDTCACKATEPTEPIACECSECDAECPCGGKCTDECDCDCNGGDSTEPGSLTVTMNVEGAPYDLVYQFAIGKFASEDLDDPESFQGYVDAKGNVVPPYKFDDIPFMTLKNGQSLTVMNLEPGTYAMAVYPEGIDIKGYDVTLPGGKDGAMFVTVRSTDTTVATLNIVYTPNGEKPIDPKDFGSLTVEVEVNGAPAGSNLDYQFVIGKFSTYSVEDFVGFVDAYGNVKNQPSVLTLKSGNSLTVNHLEPGMYGIQVLPEGIDIDGYGVVPPGDGMGCMYVTVSSSATATATLEYYYISDDGSDSTEPGTLTFTLDIVAPEEAKDTEYQFIIGWENMAVNPSTGEIVDPSYAMEHFDDFVVTLTANNNSHTVPNLKSGFYYVNPVNYPFSEIEGYEVQLMVTAGNPSHAYVPGGGSARVAFSVVYMPTGNTPETSGPEISGPETSGPETSGPEISVTKKVVGGGNAAKNKQYTIVVKDSKGKVVGKVVLKDGETKTVKLPKAGKYTITEQNASISGYKWTHTISKKTGPETSGPEISGPETSGPEISGPETSGPGFSVTVKGGESIIVTNRYTKSGGTREPVVHPQETVPIPPVEDIPDEEPPLVELPDEEPPLVELPDEDPPLAPAKPEVTIPDDDVPLAAVPKTGDESAVWFYLAILSASALLCLAVVDWKKSKKN